VDERVRRHSAGWIAEQVLAVTRQALDRLTAQVCEATQETVGEDSPEGQAILASFTIRRGQASNGGGYGSS
jgi:hypothetical protein